MRIAHLIPQFYPYIGGAEICVHNICNTLGASGHEAFVITTTPPPSEALAVNYNIIRISSKTGGLFRRFPKAGKLYLQFKLSQLQKKYKFDLWQVTMGFPLGAYAVDFFKKNKIPCILRCCGEDIQKFPEISYGYRLNSDIDALVTAKYPLYDGLVALTPSVKEEYMKIGIPKSKIKIIPNGVNNLKFKEARSNSVIKENIRKELGVNDGQLLILTVGRYHPKKGFDLIPSIAAKLKEKGLDFVWVIAGKKSSEICAKFPECKNLNIKAVEKFAGNSEDKFNLPSPGLINLYCSADIFVLPTLIETFGMVLVEAMAAGLPIVTTDAEGVKDVIEHGVNGLKAPSGNIEKISGIISELIADKELKNRLSNDALLTAENTYDWKTVTDKYIGFYREIIDKKKV
ncbi:MAG: hypothetical protein A2017_08650 [Lentisphaerae bacterium GWF2_44_16]|nr:MAG: hypothetical protein A2017_08650 [Lentisphaerae bacterium GWF2_44_16]